MKFTLDMKTNKPCPICGKTPKQANHVACGLAMDAKKSTEIGIGGITAEHVQTAKYRKAQKSYQSGMVPGFAAR